MMSLRADSLAEHGAEGRNGGDVRLGELQFCPFHSNAMWRDLKDNDPAAWREAVAVDYAIRRTNGFESAQYLHKDMVPLTDADLTTAEDHGQIDQFNNECEGMCGV